MGRNSRIQIGPDDGETPREFAQYVLKNIVGKKDPDAALCLDGEEWVIETALPADAVLGVRLVHPNGTRYF